MRLRLLAGAVLLMMAASAAAQPPVRVSLRSAYWKYLSATYGGGAGVTATAGTVGPYETFNIVYIPAFSRVFISTHNGWILQDHGLLVTADRNTTNEVILEPYYASLGIYRLRKGNTGLYWCATSTGTVYADYSAPPSWCYWYVNVF